MSRFERFAEVIGPSLPRLAFRRGRYGPATLEGDSGGAPSAPDPWASAAAQTGADKSIATYNKALNLNNSQTPFGGQYSYVSGYDPQSGAPIYQTVNYASPQTNALLNQDQNAAGWYGQQINPGGAMAAGQQGQDAFYKQQTAYLDPQFAQQGNQLQAQLAAQGIMPGSTAYNNEMDAFNRQKTFAYNQAQQGAITQGQQYGLNQLQAQDSLANSAYNRLNMARSLVPGMSSVAQTAVPNSNISQAMQNAYQGQLNSYNADVANNNATMQGVGSLAVMAAMMMSDRRTKTAIKRIGTTPAGLPWYEFSYKASPSIRYQGVMADEAEVLFPHAVITRADGLKMVNYARIG